MIEITIEKMPEKYWEFTPWAEKFTDRWTIPILQQLKEHAPVAEQPRSHKSGGGHLRDSLIADKAVSGERFSMVFMDSAHYFDWVVRSGTPPHDIPNSFGLGPNFGIGGRFSGKFHPGIGNEGAGYPPVNDFPQKVWDTMMAGMLLSLARSIEQEFV